MTHYPYLIVGGGMTADAAARGIRELDAKSPIGLIGAEPDAPYARPPLTKGLWKGAPFEGVWRNTREAGIDLHLGRRAMALDPRARRVTDDRGSDYTFDKLLLATGVSPRRLPLPGDSPIVYFRTLEDYRRLRALANPGATFAVIGGGFIGSEIAASLAVQRCKVILLFPEDGIGARLFPHDLAWSLVDYYREKGVEVHPGQHVIDVERSGSRIAVKTESGSSFSVDGVVAGVGTVPNTELAAAAGIAVENGIPVDERLRTSDPAVFAAGDVASFVPPSLGKRIRVEHEDNAVTMGKAAGRSMAGDESPYRHLPLFYSDLFDLGYEAVGELDPRGETVSDWKEKFREGVVYYLSAGRVRGVLLWNTWNQVDNARALIAEPGPFTAASLQGRLPKE
ncbi:MAG TPA: FAD-dependent oxidoreductase [Thermoanaerobaculia bacterium]|nr:FAD-dependent oxidoreductase [Thermoanaerobaculia bacterium]